MSEKDIEKSAEQLSALMDGEVSELELRRVLKQVEGSPALASKWSNYQLTSAILKGHTQGRASQWQDVDLSAGIRSVIDNEPALNTGANAKKSASALLKPFANVAVAASVSAAVILGWQNFNTGSVVSGPAVTASTASAFQPSASADSGLMVVSQSTGASANPFKSQAKQPDIIRYNPANDDRLNYYLISHSSNAAMNTASSVTPYARVVTIKPTAKSQPAKSEVKTTVSNAGN